MNRERSREKWTVQPGAHARRDGQYTRRRFLRDVGVGAAGLAIGSRLLRSSLARAGARNSRIVRTCHAGATSGMHIASPWAVDLMVQTAIRELTGIPQTGAAWKSLFPRIDATKKIGIKINLACGDVPTHPEVVDAIVNGLLLMDLNGLTLPENQIIVWDADNAFFCAQTGYTVNYGGAGVQYYGTDHAGVGYDSGRVFTISHPHGSQTQHHPSRILSQYIDYLIDASVIKDHSDAGVTLSLKNHYGSFDGIAVTQLHQSGYYGDGQARGEPELNRVIRDELGGKVRLWLIDATLGLYNGGPGYTPPWHTPPNWAYNSVIAGVDPVATDRIGTIKINEERARHGLAALDPSAVRAAAQSPYNLGTDDPLQIDLVEIDLSAQAAPEESAGPAGLTLFAPSPNPSRDGTALAFTAPRPVEAELVIVDASGSLVRRVAAGAYGRGTHRLRWDGRDAAGHAVASGTYFCRLTADGARLQQRIVRVR
jgi:uncharacterized protein (DUF362 family)